MYVLIVSLFASSLTLPITAWSSENGQFKCYSPWGKKCNYWCGSSIIRNVDMYGCCGDEIEYVKRTEICCATNVYPRSYMGCCKGVPYNLHRDECCEGKVFAKDSGLSCCGGKPYQTKTHDCCGDEIFKMIQGTTCCGHQVINEMMNQECCAGKPYNSLTEDCCENEVITIPSQGCCGDKSYNFVGGRKELCCTTIESEYLIYTYPRCQADELHHICECSRFLNCAERAEISCFDRGIFEDGTCVTAHDPELQCPYKYTTICQQTTIGVAISVVNVNNSVVFSNYVRVPTGALIYALAFAAALDRSFAFKAARTDGPEGWGIICANTCDNAGGSWTVTINGSPGDLGRSLLWDADYVVITQQSGPVEK